ncbi:MAG: DUF58 domain-containing protein [Pseudomonadota bacterium]
MDAAPSWWARLRRRGAERVAAWSRRRHGSEPGEVTITRRRVYILPTGLGITFGAMLFAMLLAGLNYGNNLALLLTFLLASAGWVAMHQCHHNLAGLQLAPAGTRPAFAGSPAEFSFRLSTSAAREELAVSSGALSHTTVGLAAQSSALVTVALPTARRGRIRLTRLRIASSYPLGLFTAWSWVHPDLDCLVYPRPAPRDGDGPPPAAEAGAAHDGRARGEEDFASLRAFQDGDPPRRIAWKAWARGGELVVKQYIGAARAPVMLELAAVPGRDLEARLARLARWIIDAEERGDRYGVRLGALEIPPGAGLPHRNRCLAPLAVWELPGDAA